MSGIGIFITIGGRTISLSCFLTRQEELKATVPKVTEYMKEAKERKKIIPMSGRKVRKWTAQKDGVIRTKIYTEEEVKQYALLGNKSNEC